MPLKKTEFKQLASALFHATKHSDGQGDPYIHLQTVFNILRTYSEDEGWVSLKVDKVKQYMNYEVFFPAEPVGNHEDPVNPF